MSNTTYNTQFQWNNYKGLNNTSLSNVNNMEDGTETLLIGKVKTIETKSAKVDGIFIENHFAIVHIVDASSEIEIMIDSEKLQQIQDMNLNESIVFKVKITDTLFNDDIFKKIDVKVIMTLDEAGGYTSRNL